ncbi:hypothetical protein B0H63DRAFT_150643 [Podospora didyma]|uniref:Uncharacterized protein n=1 Tax=Podospora didyma TaxID=330526 RepID=A0AAE0U180_9PEZI|nr:hypothetical protein B0H63DRAFT_150643 [Podospora didyma]
MSVRERPRVLAESPSPCSPPCGTAKGVGNYTTLCDLGFEILRESLETEGRGRGKGREFHPVFILPLPLSSFSLICLVLFCVSFLSHSCANRVKGCPFLVLVYLHTTVTPRGNPNADPGPDGITMLTTNRHTAAVLLASIFRVVLGQDAAGVKWLYPPSDGLVFAFDDNVAVQYESKFDSPKIYIYCNSGSGPRLIKGQDADEFNGVTPMWFDFSSTTPCYFSLRQSGQISNSPTFTISNVDRNPEGDVTFGLNNPLPAASTPAAAAPQPAATSPKAVTTPDAVLTPAPQATAPSPIPALSPSGNTAPAQVQASSPPPTAAAVVVVDNNSSPSPPLSPDKASQPGSAPSSSSSKNASSNTGTDTTAGSGKAGSDVAGNSSGSSQTTGGGSSTSSGSGSGSAVSGSGSGSISNTTNGNGNTSGTGGTGNGNTGNSGGDNSRSKDDNGIGSSSSPSGGLSPGQAAGIGLGVSIGAIILAMIGFVLFRRRRRQKEAAAAAVALPEGPYSELEGTPGRWYAAFLPSRKSMTPPPPSQQQPPPLPPPLQSIMLSSPIKPSSSDIQEPQNHRMVYELSPENHPIEMAATPPPNLHTKAAMMMMADSEKDAAGGEYYHRHDRARSSSSLGAYGRTLVNGPEKSSFGWAEKAW